MKTAYAQMKISAGHPDINTKKILHFIDEARAQGADIIIFPELAVSGKMLGETREQELFLRECERCGEEIIAASKDIVVAFGNISVDWREKINGKYFKYDALFFARDGKVIAKVNDSGEFDIYLGNKKYWLGYACGNASFDYRSDFCINVSAAPFSFGKKIRNEKISAQFPVIQVGCVGIQNIGKTIYAFDGGSAVFNSRGEVVQRIESFTEGLNFVELDEIDKMPALELDD